MSRNINFDNNLYYHVFNRGVDRRKIFLDEWDYRRFLESMQAFNQVNNVYSLYHKNRRNRGRSSASTAVEAELLPSSSELVSLVAYCLNPTHFHLLVKQKTEKGISKFLHKLQTGYTNYFNAKNNRSGSLLQGPYKAKEINSTYDLLKVSIYINANAEIHNIAKKENWNWSSFSEYNLTSKKICDINIVYNEINKIDYLNLMNDLIPDIKKVKYEDLEKSKLE